MKKILITVLAASSVSAFAAIFPDNNAKPTKAFENFVEQVSSDITTINNAQIKVNQSYKGFNYELVYKAKGKGKGIGTTFINSAQVNAYPHLVAANNALNSINPNGSLVELNAALTKAQQEVTQYQIARQNLFNDPAVQAEGYFIVNREANAFLCALQSAEAVKNGGSKFTKFLVNAKNYADCIVSHEANKDKDLEKKAQVYASTVTTPASIANTLLANATYFNSERFIDSVNSFVLTQKSDAKKALDQNINSKTCQASLDSFRVQFDKTAQVNTSLKMIALASQPKSTVRAAVDLFAGEQQGKMISDALNIAHLYITGTQVKDVSKNYDLCDYEMYKKNKSNNIYASKLIDFDKVAARTNGALSAEQVYQLSVIASAKSTEYVISDKTSGANKLFNK